jgi:copper chaperone CopZ
MARSLALMGLLVAVLSVAACGAPDEQVIEATSERGGAGASVDPAPERSGGEEAAGQAPQSEVTAGAPGAGPGVGKTTAAASPEQAAASYKVPTITCPSCAARVEASAEKDPGVLGVRVEGQRAVVEYDPARTDPEKIAEAIRAGGDTVIQGG